MASPVTRVLRILQLVQEAPNTSLIDMMVTWGVDKTDKAQVARVRSFLIDEIRQAELEIRAGGTPGHEEELIPALKALEDIFAGDLFNTGTGAYPALGPTIAAFKVIVKAANLQSPERPSVIDELITCIRQLIDDFEDADIDPLIKETALQHLRVLIILMNYVEAFGVNTAKVEFTALLLRLNSAGQSRPAEAKKAQGLVERVKGLLGLIKEADEAYEHGKKLIDHAHDFVNLIS